VGRMVASFVAGPSSYTEVRQGSAVEISRFASSTFFAWCGLQTSKIRR